MDDLVEMIDDLLGTSDDDGAYLRSHEDPDFGSFADDGDDDGGSSVEWYGTESPYEATSRVLAEQHATNLEV